MYLQTLVTIKHYLLCIHFQSLFFPVLNIPPLGAPDFRVPTSEFRERKTDQRWRAPSRRSPPRKKERLPSLVWIFDFESKTPLFLSRWPPLICLAFFLSFLLVNNYSFISVNLTFIQWAPLNEIGLGQAIFDYNHQMITLSKLPYPLNVAV